MRKLFLLTTLMIMLCCARAQSEAYYAELLADPALTVTGAPISCTFNGTAYSIAWSDIEAIIENGQDMLDLRVVDSARAADGRVNDPIQVFTPTELGALNDAVRAELLKAAAARPVGLSSFPTGGSASDVNATPFNQAAVLDAIAQVIVDRVKEELARAYFDKMAVKMDSVQVLKHQCGGGKKPIGLCTLTDLMPATQLVFKESRNHISSHAGATLKAAFAEDLTDFPAHFTAAYTAGLKNAEGATCGATIAGKELTVLTAAQLLSGITERRPWLDVLQGIADTEVGSAAWHKHRAALDLSLRVIESLQGEDGDFLSMKPTDWPVARMKAYLGMMLLNPRVKEDLDELGIDPQAHASIEKLRAVLGEAAIMIEAAKEIKTIISSSGLSVQSRSDQYLQYVQHIEAFIAHGFAAVKALNEVWGGRLPMPDALIPVGLEAFVSATMDLQAAVLDGAYGKASLQVLRMLDQALPADGLLDQDLVKLVTLAADMAEAGPGEVKGIFEAAIMPVGSYRVKQSTRFSAHLNAYPGLFGGMETIRDGGTKPFGGVAGPIGIALSRSRGSEDSLKASNTIMLGIIDIGALLTYRFDHEDSVSANSEVTFSTVLAPGLYYMHGFKNTPLALGVGAQYAPRLRGVSTDAIDLGPQDAFRIGVTLAVDIPLFPLSLRRKPVSKIAAEVRALEAELTQQRDRVPPDPQAVKELEEQLAKKKKCLKKGLE